MTAKVPTSKAKTAYGVLSEIARLSAEEPKRMRMSIVGGWPNNASHYVEADEAPACGTVGCIAGWVLTLREPHDPHELMGRTTRAGQILGLTEKQQIALFCGPLCNTNDQGTRRHAQNVVGLIRRFQQKYRAQLLAKKV